MCTILSHSAGVAGRMAGAMSKFAERGGGGLGLARAAYVGAILAYVGGVAVPRWLNYQRAEEQKRRAKRREGGEPEASLAASPEKKTSKGNGKGPAVNKEFFAQLLKLLKVGGIHTYGGEYG